ncbi:MAG: hypothetical protein JWQ47_2285 [Glaciihabitans sp.]|nr:hypothetical protein [Glaciihabitans sp.]
MPAGSDGPPDGVYMSWGHASPPAFPIGTKPEDVPGILAGTVILINPVSYMLVSLPRLRQIHEVMGTFLAQIDEGEKARLDRQK